jgi:hypothetical protein
MKPDTISQRLSSRHGLRPCLGAVSGRADATSGTRYLRGLRRLRREHAHVHTLMFCVARWACRIDFA